MGFFDSVQQTFQNPLGNIGKTLTNLSPLGIFGPGLFDEAGKMINGPEAPSFQPINPSENLQGQLNAQTQRAAQTPEQYKQQYLEGVSGAAGDVGFDPMSEALSGRSKRLFQKSAGDLNRQAELQGRNTYQQRAAHAIDTNQALENYKRGINYQAQQIAFEADKARSAVLAELLTGIGKGAGTAIGMMNKQGPSPSGGLFSGQNYQADFNASAPPIGTAFA